jgi:ankyrin repeat protein
MEKFKNKLQEMKTMIHFASRYGHLEVCTAILAQVMDKNPKGYEGETPLHEAAYSGHLLVYKEITQYIENKNPKSNIGLTPLHYAAQEGHLDIRQHIFEHVEHKILQMKKEIHRFMLLHVMVIGMFVKLL